MSRETNERAERCMLFFLLIVNTIILEKGITMNANAYWFLLVSLPLVVLAFFKLRRRVSS